MASQLGGGLKNHLARLALVDDLSFERRGCFLPFFMELVAEKKGESSIHLRRILSR